MAKASWKESVSQDRIQLFEYLLRNLFSETFEWEFLFHVNEYVTLLDQPLSKFVKDSLYTQKALIRAHISKKRKTLEKRREKSDYLPELIRRWIRAKQDPTGLTSITEHELSISFQNVLSLVTWKFTISELAKLACIGDDLSGFRLVELNKRFLTATWMKERIIQAQRFGDSDYFDDLGRAVLRDARNEHLAQAEIGFAVLMLWHLGFKDLPLRELLDFVHKRFGYPDQNLPSFRVLVTRLGLKKYRKA